MEPGTTLQNLYREYSKQTTTAKIHCVSYPLFDKAMKDCNINITIFLPKKEQCDKCLSAKEDHIIRDYLFIETNKLKFRDMFFPFNVNNYYAMFPSLDYFVDFCIVKILKCPVHNPLSYIIVNIDYTYLQIKDVVVITVQILQYVILMLYNFRSES